MSNSVSVPIEQLIAGRSINFPIHDSKGVLLLAANSTITADKLQRLKKRGIRRILMDETDVANTTTAAAKLAGSGEDEVDPLTRRLESLVNSGQFAIRNTGPSVRRSVVRHGKKQYDAEAQKELSDELQSSSESLDRLMHDAANGDAVDSSSVGEIATAQLRNLTQDFESILTTSFDAFGDTSLADHSLKVALLGMAIGVDLGLDNENVRTIGISGLVQDLGMAQVPKAIREAKRRLTQVEFLEILKHPRWTAKILEGMHDVPNVVRLVAYQIHERMDGSGYPHGREGQRIHFLARILHVADAYTAMTTPRPYRPALMAHAAVQSLLLQCQRKQIDPVVMRCLLNVLSLFPIGSYVSLSDGSIAQVLRPNGDNYAKPIVNRVELKQGIPTAIEDADAMIDLANSDLSIIQALPTPGRIESGLDTNLPERCVPSTSAGARPVSEL